MDLMTIRRRLLTETPLPVGYTRLHYIRGSGAYINTDLILQSGCVIDITFEVENSTVEQAVWGYRYAGNWSAVSQAHIYYNGGNRVIALGKGISVAQHGNNSAYQFDTLNRLIIDTARNRVLLNGLQPEINYDFSNGAMFNADGSSVYPPYLLASNRAGTTGATSSKAKIYGYKVSQSGRTSAHMIPCIDPGGVYGMYDVIRRQFFGSANSSRLTGG